MCIIISGKSSGNPRLMFQQLSPEPLHSSQNATITKDTSLSTEPDVEDVQTSDIISKVVAG